MKTEAERLTITVKFNEDDVKEMVDEIMNKLVEEGEYTHVVHAKWLDDGVYPVCGHCHTEMYPMWDYVKTPYCPYCGAKMDKED